MAEIEYVDVIDENERVLKTVPKAVAIKENSLRSGGEALVFNSKGLLLIQKRAECKRAYPGLWDIFVGGWRLSGESVEESLKREAEEEIGAKNFQPEFLFKFRFKYENMNNDISYVYKIIYDGPIILQEEEVSEYEYVRVDELSRIMNERKFTPKAKYVFENYENKIRM